MILTSTASAQLLTPALTETREDKLLPPKRINLIDKIISKPFLNDKDLINDVHNNELKFQSSKGKEKKILLACPITSVDIRKGKKAREIHVAGLSCLWDTGASDSMVKK
jgi:hypothetical protein